jgi:hypothetical protein
VGQLPVVVVPPPIEFPRMMYYQLWHERTHGSSAGRWLREQIKTVAASLRKEPRHNDRSTLNLKKQAMKVIFIMNLRLPSTP